MLRINADMMMMGCDVRSLAGKPYRTAQSVFRVPHKRNHIPANRFNQKGSQTAMVLTARNKRMASFAYAIIIGLVAFCVVGTTLLTTCDGAILPAALADSPVYFGGIVPANGRFGKKIHHFPNTMNKRQPSAVVGSELHHTERNRTDDA